MKTNLKTLVMLAAGWVGFCLLTPEAVHAHCDTMDGPVVKAAAAALEEGDVLPVLKWVKQEHEAELRAAFEHTLRVRKGGPEARELADRYFFETVVRLHRMGEGAPYTGLKPAGTGVGPAIRAADKALKTGSAGALLNLLTADMAAGIRQRFERALEKKKRADESVEAGREFVEAYVEFVHYVERLHLHAEGAATAPEAAEAASPAGAHEH